MRGQETRKGQETRRGYERTGDYGEDSFDGNFLR